MRKVDSNWLSMALSVKVFCTLNAIFDHVPGFAALLAQLGIIIGKIQDSAVVQVLDAKGKTAVKKLMKTELVGHDINLVRALIAYARNNNLVELYEEVSYTESKLNRLSGTNLLSVSHFIYEKARDAVGELAEYDVTQATVDAQKAAMDNFSKALTGPRDNIVLKKNATLALKAEFKDGRGLIVKLDDLADTLMTKDPDAYNGYKNARVIVNYGKGKKSYSWYLEGKAIDFETGLPAAGVNVGVVGTMLIVVTGIDGLFKLEVPGPGEYTLRAEHPNYGDKIQDVVRFGEPTEIIIEMEKAEEA